MSSFLTEPGALERIFALDMQRRQQRQIGVRRYDSFTFGPADMELLDEPLKRPPRKTLRYNWINVFRDGEVEIEHVAVRLNAAGGQVAKLVAVLRPAEKTVQLRDMNFGMIAGWHVEWRSKDWRGKSTEPMLADGYLENAWWGMPLKFGRAETFAWHETVNLEALAESRYRYCQYNAEKCGGLVDWLMMFAQDSKVELLAKLDLHSLVTPAGLNSLKDKRVLDFVRTHVAECRDAMPRSVTYAARHGVSVLTADDHFENVQKSAEALRGARSSWRRMHGRKATFRIDADRVERALGKWHVSWTEYGNYIEDAIEAGMDPRNEGTLYPPTSGGRKAFMGRAERVEAARAEVERQRELARRRAEREERKRERDEQKWLIATASIRRRELVAFQASAQRSAILRGTGYTLVVAKSQQELLAQGKRFHNCVGNGIYGRAVAVGDALIVIVNGKGGKPAACIEIRRDGWKVRQCYAPGNEVPPAGMRTLARRLAALFKKEHNANLKAKRFAALERKTA